MNELTTLLEAVQYFSDPDRALDFVVRLRWPGGISCPRCGHDAVRFIRTRRMWTCKGCKRQFSAKVHTIFEDSPIGFEKWLPAMWLLCNAKNGISSWELHRAIGVTQKTAWFMLHRFRLAMQTETFEKMAGHIEADETFIGGAARFMHPEKRAEKVHGRGGAGSGKAVVMGLLERHSDGTSQVRVKHVGDTTRQTLHGRSRGPTSASNRSTCSVIWTSRRSDSMPRHGDDPKRMKRVLTRVVGRRVSYDKLTGKTPNVSYAAI